MRRAAVLETSTVYIIARAGAGTCKRFVTPPQYAPNASLPAAEVAIPGKTQLI